MASREVTRLKRLKVDNLSEDRLRSELQRATVAFETENQSMEQRLATMQTSLTRMTQQVQSMNARFADQSVQLKTAQDERAKAVAEVEQLRTTLEKTEAGTFATAETPEFTARINQLEFDKLQLESQLAGTRVLLDSLQKDQAVRDEQRTVITTRDLYATMATEVAEAATKLPAGFAIDDIEVEVKGALGQEGENVVLGLDAKQAITGDSATRLKFTLRRAVTETKVE